MRNLYSVLRVAPKAGDAEIKRAFRHLAKTCHPDVKPCDKEAEEAFQEVKRAYKFLSNAETRKVYDAFLAARRAEARHRFMRAAATMAATFVLTTASVLLVWLHVAGSELGGDAGRANTVEIARAAAPSPGDDAKAGGAQAPAQAAEERLRETPTAR